MIKQAWVWFVLIMAMGWSAPHYGSFEQWGNLKTEIKPTMFEVGSGTLTANATNVYTVWGVKLDQKLYINWVKDSSFTQQLGKVLMAVNGPLHVGQGGLILYPQSDTTTRMTAQEVDFSEQNLHVLHSINWYDQTEKATTQNRKSVIGSIERRLNLGHNQLEPGFHQWQTLVQAFGPSPREAYTVFNPDPGPKYDPKTFNLSFNIPNQRQKKNYQELLLLSGGTAYVVKNLHLASSSPTNYTILTGPYRIDSVMSDSLPSSILGFTDVVISKNTTSLLSMARDELVVANPSTYFKVGASAIGFPTGIMLGGVVANSGITVGGSALITGQFGGEIVNEASNRINWNNGALQEIEVGSAGKLLQFIDPVFGQMGVLPTTLYLFVKRTGAGRLSFDNKVRWPVATGDHKDTNLYRSYDINSELDQVRWYEVDSNSPLYELFTFIFDGKFYLAAYSGLYNTKDNGNGRWF